MCEEFGGLCWVDWVTNKESKLLYFGHIMLARNTVDTPRSVIRVWIVVEFAIILYVFSNILFVVETISIV